MRPKYRRGQQQFKTKDNKNYLHLYT